MDLIRRYGVEVWPLEQEDVLLARQLHEQYLTLSARDLCHRNCSDLRGIVIARSVATRQSRPHARTILRTIPLPQRDCHAALAMTTT